MNKINIYPWYRSSKEESTITKCGYPINEIFETEKTPFEIMSELYQHDVTVCLRKPMKDSDAVFYISVCDSWRMGQR